MDGLAQIDRERILAEIAEERAERSKSPTFRAFEEMFDDDYIIKEFTPDGFDSE